MSADPTPLPDRDDLAFSYLDQLPYPPYPFQEEAILAWFDSGDGLLVCAPTGMGKTLIAEAGLYEALKLGKRAYYTTPLIALTEQKYREIRASAERWGFGADSVGLITGNRKENPDAPILVVVAEILFNRLLGSDDFARSAEQSAPARAEGEPSGGAGMPASLAPFVSETALSGHRFSFDDVSVVVMDEFHQFSDPERGIVWEFTLGLLPPHVRTLLISATVGNAYEFVSWLRTTANRRLALVRSDERKVPLEFRWVGDELLPDLVEQMHRGTDGERMVPTLIFCFNRDQCWDTAEIIKGKNIIDAARQKALTERLAEYDWTKGAGPKLRQFLLRGIGLHHAGILPKYRRIIETLYQERLLSVAVCTETLSAGINLPARSVVLPTIMKGPPGEKKIIDSSTAHQIFGRAGRPQYDDRGFVLALAHADDVKIARAREKYDLIPEDTKDPKLREAKKKLKKKIPTRNPNEQYWTEEQFYRLRDSSPGSLTSRGPVPWRLLAHMIQSNADLAPLRRLVAHRLMGAKRLAAQQQALDDMLITLWRGGFIRLEPDPAGFGIEPTVIAEEIAKTQRRIEKEKARRAKGFGNGLFDDEALGSLDFDFDAPQDSPAAEPAKPLLLGGGKPAEPPKVTYKAERAFPTESLGLLTHIKGFNPIYGAFLLSHLGKADRAERIQAFESLLEMPGNVARLVRVPGCEELPPGALAREWLDARLLDLGLASADELVPKTEEEKEREREERRRFGGWLEERVYLLSFAEKLQRLFDYEYPLVPVRITPVWSAGEVILRYNGDFNKYITSNSLQKQEGVVFRHLLRLILLLEEFRPLIPAGTTRFEWENELNFLSETLTACCRAVDPASTDQALADARRKETE